MILSPIFCFNIGRFQLVERGGTNNNPDLTVMVQMVWCFTYKSLTITV